MTLLFFDGFDDYDAGTDCVNFGKWYDSYYVNIISGRTDGKAARVSGNSYTYQSYTYQSSTNFSGVTLILGFALRIYSVADSGYIVNFKNTSNNNQCELYFDSVTRLLQIRRNGTLLASGITEIQLNTWHFIEIKYLCDDIFGIFEVRLNESSEIVFSGNTQAQGNDTWHRIRFGTRVANDSAEFDFDDFYLLDTTGTHNNSWLGDIQCKIIRPSADYATQFTAVNAVNNYQAVDDLIGAPNNATDYVYSNTVGHVDQYSLTDMPAADAVYGVKLNTRAQKDDVNPRFFKQGIKTGINTNESSDYNLGTSYANYLDIFEHQGDVSETAWTESAVNAARSTIEVSA